LTYSVYESAAGLASHANVTVRSASAEVASISMTNTRIMALVLAVQRKQTLCH
jgi:alkylated DNA repair dioxygenase AlkB